MKTHNKNPKCVCRGTCVRVMLRHTINLRHQLDSELKTIIIITISKFCVFFHFEPFQYRSHTYLFPTLSIHSYYLFHMSCLCARDTRIQTAKQPAAGRVLHSSILFQFFIFAYHHRVEFLFFCISTK